MDSANSELLRLFLNNKDWLENHSIVIEYGSATGKKLMRGQFLATVINNDDWAMHGGSPLYTTLGQSLGMSIEEALLAACLRCMAWEVRNYYLEGE